MFIKHAAASAFVAFVNPRAKMGIMSPQVSPGSQTYTRGISFMSSSENDVSHIDIEEMFARSKKENDHENSQDYSIQDLCTLFSAGPDNLLSMKTSNGERGVFLNKDIQENDIILQIPLESCIRDDKPPDWYVEYQAKDQSEDDDNPHLYNPSEWASRLSASLIDIQLNYGESMKFLTPHEKWFSMMPDPEYLRASLPIHWPEEILEKARCISLELANDAMYFPREGAMSDLATALESSEEALEKLEEKDLDLEMICSNSWDLVQTRSCRVERIDGIQLCPPLRVLAPIFDFINHASCQYDGEGSSNAYFGLEGNDEEGDKLNLAVRARRDMKAQEEVLIDYGDSARPAWRCLSSYGFVPNYRQDEPAFETGADESVAELFFNGKRYEVSRDTIPTDLVEAAYASYLEEEVGLSAFDEVGDSEEEIDNSLPPEVALRIAKRMSDTAFDLLIDHSEDSEDGGGEDEGGVDPETVAMKLASSLRMSQHQVLMACAVNLRDYAMRENP
jgi:hypothetical protein